MDGNPVFYLYTALLLHWRGERMWESEISLSFTFNTFLFIYLLWKWKQIFTFTIHFFITYENLNKNHSYPSYLFTVKVKTNRSLSQFIFFITLNKNLCYPSHLFTWLWLTNIYSQFLFSSSFFEGFLL